MQLIMSLLDDGRTAVKRYYEAMGWGKLLLCPPIESALNIVDFGLFWIHHEVGKVEAWRGGFGQVSDIRQWVGIN